MGNILIKAEDISKHYRLGVLGSRTLKEDLRRWWRTTLMPNRDHSQPVPESSRNELWALKNISFEVQQGEVLGVLGNNGAGKSTLLKIISRITLPSSGRIRGKGRTASLLEVGTGFHAELTGRENIFLNGHIMGMRKKEIEAKFDEIVEFSGSARFLDTPVKRYSSGMYVRLAFAVAAHLDPEILIIDEVLAVGDADFQKKCIGKMKEVSTQKGKTILFVSHNMQAVRNLCNRALTLEEGRITNWGDPETVIARYLKKENAQILEKKFSGKEAAPGNEYIRIREVRLTPIDQETRELIDVRTPLDLYFEFWQLTELNPGPQVHVQLFTDRGECVFDLVSERSVPDKGLICAGCRIPGHLLNDGGYSISLAFTGTVGEKLYEAESILQFEVADWRRQDEWPWKWPGMVRPEIPVWLGKKEAGPQDSD